MYVERGDINDDLGMDQNMKDSLKNVEIQSKVKVMNLLDQHSSLEAQSTRAKQLSQRNTPIVSNRRRSSPLGKSEVAKRQMDTIQRLQQYDEFKKIKNNMRE